MSALPEHKPHPEHKSNISNFIVWLQAHEGWTITSRLIQKAEEEL